MKQILSQRHSMPQRPNNPFFSASTSTRSCMSRATPSRMKAIPSPVRVLNISDSLLTLTEQSNTVIGKGCFGSCVRMVFKDLYPVCVKMFESSTSLAALRYEAGILSLLNTEYTPHCFGTCEEKRAIVMSCITLSDTPITLHSFLIAPPEGIPLSSALAVQILLDVSKGLQCIHAAGFIHNDIKLDNIVLGNSANGNTMKAYIIDFGKACAIGNGKTYDLSSEQVTIYKKQHPQIAPDLRDGKTRQNPATDVYSLGRVIRKTNCTMAHSDEITTLQKQAMRYSSSERPSLTDIVAQLQEIRSSL